MQLPLVHLKYPAEHSLATKIQEKEYKMEQSGVQFHSYISTSVSKDNIDLLH